jgi:glucose-6-phosphate 1-dehydrogenase
MATNPPVGGHNPSTSSQPGEPCVLVLLGASGDLTKRLLVPAMYNLACDGLLPERFAVVGLAADALTTESFRARLSDDVRRFHTRKDFDESVWQRLAPKFHYVPGRFDDGAAFARLRELVDTLSAAQGIPGNRLCYLAVPPSFFGPAAAMLDRAGLRAGGGWKRLIVEKPFGTDTASARALNDEIHGHWDEQQIYRIDHYLGKETVQNVLAFRFANELFEPLWNARHIDHVQFNVAEAVGVEGRGGYYDKAGVLRDMIQNHMLQMLAYFAMEPPNSFAADDVRDRKAELLKAVRRYSPEEVFQNAVRGQYAAGRKADGSDAVAYRAEQGVPPGSNTETFAAMRLFIDAPRWQGVPFYLRSGKALWKRGTEIVVQFKRPPAAMFEAAGKRPSANRLIFHIQPDQAIETLLQAKSPGPAMRLQPVNMRFGYGESFRASRGTGYEVMLYSAMTGDATLFSRTDLLEAAWGIAQPFLDAWTARPERDLQFYPAGSWGPRAASELLKRDGRRWFEVINRDLLERVPLFKGGDPLLLSQVSMAVRPQAVPAGEAVVTQGEPGAEMFVICRGEVEVERDGRVVATLGEGGFFGEIALVESVRRTATVRAKSPCDLFVLDRADFDRILRDHEQFAVAIRKAVAERYGAAAQA